MEIVRELQKSILLYDTANISVLIQDSDLYIKWEAMGKHHQICCVDCIYFEWIDNQEMLGLHGIREVEKSPLLGQLLGESNRFQRTGDYKMHHFQIGSLYGRELNLICHDIKPVEK